MTTTVSSPLASRPRKPNSLRWNIAFSLMCFSSLAAAEPGTIAWERRYDGPASRSDFARDVAVDAAGNVVVTGDSYDADGLADYYTAVYAADDGALLWEAGYDGPGTRDDRAQAVAIDGAGNVVVTGSSNNAYLTLKYAGADGALLWEQRSDSPASADQPQALAVDREGNVLVTGYSASPRGNLDYYTVKYAAEDGALLWEVRYNGLGDSADIAVGVAVDGNGNVVVTGYSLGATGNDDYYTVKYAADDGTLLWEMRYNGPADSGDYATAVAVDGAGNVAVTGYSNNARSFSDRFADYYTAKYAAVDGALLWENRYNGPSNAKDAGRAVAIDAADNVIVTGESFANGLPDYYTAKYQALDGALSWENRYDGPASSFDYATAVAVDGAGNAAVTGYSIGASGNHDYYTVKYAAADGAPLWENRYNGPADSFDYAVAMAVDGAGSAVVTGSSSGSNGFDDYYTVKYSDSVAPPARPPYGLYLRGGSHFMDARGQQEKYFGGTSSLNGYHDPDGYWYYVLPNGDLYEFTPPYSNAALTGVLVAQLGSAYYENPEWLTYSLYQRDGSYFTSYRGEREKYFGGTASANGHNEPDGYWYYILANGDLHEFTPPYSSSSLAGVLVARLGAAYYDHPNLLPYRLHQFGDSYFTNSRGQQEKYLRGLVSANGYNDPDGYWYYILPGGELYEFTPPYSAAKLGGILVEQLGPAFYEDPSLLTTNGVQIP